ncbi:malto-oligosyltrehalose trehalohydrolase [Opitutaceae bacterium EW11]|nr:malto-oligosyltrehalose trehalohydrolase [Opitutaceae bacterium EW11]
MSIPTTRILPIGAEAQPGGVHFRVWAPDSPTVSVELTNGRGEAQRTVPLSAEAGGYFFGWVEEATAGTRYRYRLASGSFPDPASRFQPDGPHGDSEVVDGRSFGWTDGAWRGREAREAVIYELHLGTFTPEGTWRSATAQLPELARLGITAIEIMPVAEFPGRFGWGYDGVYPFAPCRAYGRPEDARAFVDRAHSLGLMVVLDVVYNHLGPDGNFLRSYSNDYFSSRYTCEWGEALNFDGPNSGPVREFFVSNARYWIEEYHLDGLRLDATQQIFDASPKHVLIEIARTARQAGGERTLLLVAENESQDGRLVRSPERGGYGLDAVWNDDFHHSAMVAAVGRIETYYTDHRGLAQEFVSAFKYGYLYQGQWYQWQQKRRGRPALDLPPRSFVVYLQNHDQVANSLRGLRLHQQTSPGDFRALTAVLLLTPGIPMLFQGQEFAASTPFLYFADHSGELRKRVRSGREGFLAQFRTIACPENRELLQDPSAEATFSQCKLDLAERETHRPAYRMHEDLLRVRRENAAITDAARIDGAMLRDDAFVIRYFSKNGDDRLLVVNLGTDLFYAPVSEPLLAPLEDRGWSVCWSSESPDYGGAGTPPLETTAGWVIPGRAAVLLAPDENCELPSVRLTEKN